MLQSTLVEANGTIPGARFGHTITPISPTRVLIFGGATGSSGNFSFTNDAFAFDIQKRVWKKIQSTTSPT